MAFFDANRISFLGMRLVEIGLCALEDVECESVSRSELRTQETVSKAI